MGVFERKVALTAFAKGSSGHTFGLDDLVDDVLYAHACGHLPRPGGLDNQSRHFLELLFHYAREKESAEAEALAKRTL